MAQEIGLLAKFLISWWTNKVGFISRENQLVNDTRVLIMV